ncbi:MAG: MFS transporter [Chloroflexi bacterium]|nr:MFS transporter [Chloroflexota bacterium]
MLGRILSPFRALNPQARLFFAVLVGLTFVADGLYSVLLNLYLLRLDYGTEFIGLVNAVGLLTFGLASLPAGILGSRMSTTALMKFGAVTCLAGGLLLPLAEWLPLGWREAGLVLPPALMFGGYAFYFVNGAPYLINVVDNAYKNHAFALKAAHWSLAGFAGSLTGGLLPGAIASLNGFTLADPQPYRITFALAVIILALAAALSRRIRPLPASAAPKQKAVDQKRGGGANNWASSILMLIVIMTVIRLFQVAGSATAMVYFNVYMDQHLAVSTALIGAMAAIGRLTGVPTALLTPYLVQRWGNAGVVIASSMMATLCLLPMALVQHWLAASFGYIGAVSMISVRFTAFTVYILSLVPRKHQALMAGSGEAAAGMSFAMMALGGGLLLSAFTFRDLFLLGTLFSFIGTVLFWLYVLVSKSKRKLKPAL